MSESEKAAAEVEPQLSERELEIVRLVATGASNKEIASQLFLSPNTVKVHLRNIFGKIGVQSRTEATMVAVRRGWVVVPEATAREELPEPEAEGIEAESVVAPAQIQSAPLARPEPPPIASPRIYSPPLPWALRVALVLVLILAAAGIVVTWPRPLTANGDNSSPFSDLPVAESPALASGGGARWQPGALMPTPRGRFALAAWRGKLYAVGGMTSPGGVTGALEIYDTAKNSWSLGAAKPMPVANVGAAIVNDRLIVPGGYTADGTPANAVQVYDTEADTWSTVAPLPVPLFAYALIAYDGKVYVLGGARGTRGYSEQVWQYDPDTDRWTARAPMPTPRAFAAAAVLDKAIYVVGGYDGQREFAACERYWPDRDVWETCAPLTVGRGGLGLASIAGRLYAIGGGWSGYLAFGERYDPTSNTWSVMETPLAGQWRNLAVATYRTDVYAVGGWSGQSYLAVTHKYSPLPFQIFIPAP